MEQYDDKTIPDTLRAIHEDVKATRAAAEGTANNVLAFGQELHDLKTYVQKLELRVGKLELIRLPLRFPWLALVTSMLALIAVLLLAWKVLP